MKNKQLVRTNVHKMDFAEMGFANVSKLLKEQIALKRNYVQMAANKKEFVKRSQVQMEIANAIKALLENIVKILKKIHPTVQEIAMEMESA